MRRRCNGYGMEIRDKPLIDVQGRESAGVTFKPICALSLKCHGKYEEYKVYFSGRCFQKLKLEIVKRTSFIHLWRSGSTSSLLFTGIYKLIDILFYYSLSIQTVLIITNPTYICKVHDIISFSKTLKSP